MTSVISRLRWGIASYYSRDIAELLESPMAASDISVTYTPVILEAHLDELIRTHKTGLSKKEEQVSIQLGALLINPERIYLLFRSLS